MSGITDKKLLVYTDKQTICKKSKVYELTNHINSLNNNIWKMKKNKQTKNKCHVHCYNGNIAIESMASGFRFQNAEPVTRFLKTKQ